MAHDFCHHSSYHLQDHFRNILIIQCDTKLLDEELAGALKEHVIKKIAGDWVIITTNPILSNLSQHTFTAKDAKSLLGREFKHAIFDARVGFNLEALAILAGTLVADSLFILLLPANFDYWQDEDSLRWNEQSSKRLVPNFITHLNRTIQKQKQQYPNHTFLLLMDETVNNKRVNVLADFMVNCQIVNDNYWFKDDFCGNDLYKDYTQQQALLDHLLLSQHDITLLTAKRGRGKSVLAGMFARYHRCFVTAPNKNAVTTLMKFAPRETAFYAPDELIIQLQNLSHPPDWLIIDEAAMIPISIIKKLINQSRQSQRSYKVLLTSTVDGYEGTGQGLLLKLFKQLAQDKQPTQTKKVAHYRLNSPIRWRSHDPLEYFVDALTIVAGDVARKPYDLTDCINVDSINNCVAINRLTQKQLVESQETLNSFFGLLKSAHYRTTLIDLRRLMDANNLYLYSANYLTNREKQIREKQIVGVLVAIKEGGLETSLVDDILKGYRRPRGNLVAQSLVAHAGEKRAARLQSIRINRIAVQVGVRRQGIATKLIASLIEDARKANYDFISVSFAYSSEISPFWLKLGFKTVHIGSHQEASSGSPAIMAIYPISDAGIALQRDMSKKLARNWFWLKAYWLTKQNDIYLPIEIDHNQQLLTADKLELSLFATTSYSYFASIPVLSRLAYQIKQMNHAQITGLAPLLLDLMVNNGSTDITARHYQLSGKKELLKLLRKEVEQLITIPKLFNE